MIELRGITRIYRTKEMETTALHEVTLSIAPGEFVAVMGPSGCGKSTLLGIVGMVDVPSSGKYLFDGIGVDCLPERQLVAIRKQNIGFIFQAFNLIDDLTVYENVELALLYQGYPRSQRQERVHGVLDLVNLSSRANHKPAQLSGGQQQRVAVARAVVGDPKLIVADEPTGNLDTRNGEEVMNMLGTLHEQGTTILMVTHSPAHAARADRVIELLDGHVISAGKVTESRPKCLATI